MGSYTIRIKNQSPKPQTYTVCSEGVYILESAKNALVTPTVNPGTSCDIVINDKFYVWAKLTGSSSREAILEANIGASLLLKSDGRQATIQKIDGVPEPGCFSISIDPNFLLDRGVFGLGLRASPSTAFHPLTTAEATEAETYSIQPSRIFEVAVNERYKDGDELLSSVPPTSSVTVDLEVGARFVAVVHNTNGVAEDLSVENPMVKEAEEEKREQAAAEGAAAAEKGLNLQNQSILSGHSIAATAWSGRSAWHIRVYFQDGRGGVRESRQDDGVWTGGDARSTLFTAKMGTPLSVISWDNGQQIRIYYLSSQDILQEYCYSASDGWYHGILNSQWIRVAPCSKLSAIYWPMIDPSIRIYFQGKFSHGPTSWAIQEYCFCSGVAWCPGSILCNARPGSGIAATRWFSSALDGLQSTLHMRIYYQDEQSYIRELCWQVTSGWFMGDFSQWALGLTPIAAFAWYDHQINIRVFWQDSWKVLLESKYANGWAGPSFVTDDVDEHCPFTAVELQNGQYHRVYLRDRTALVEKCKWKDGWYWFKGAFVVR